MSFWDVQTEALDEESSGPFFELKERGRIEISENMTASEIFQLVKEAGMIKCTVYGDAKFKSATTREITLIDSKTLLPVAILTRIGDPPTPPTYTDPGPTLAEMQARPAPQPAAPCCPTCHSTRLTKLSAGSRFIDRMFFGAFSPESRAQFRCMDCGYMF